MPFYSSSSRLQRWQAISIIGMFIIAVLACLYLAAGIFIPVAGAILISFMVSPLIRPLIRRGIPAPILAALVIILLLGIVGTAVVAFSKPTMDWVDRLPKVTRQLEEKFRPMWESVESVQKASADVMNFTNGSSNSRKPPTVITTTPGVMERLMNSAQEIGLQVLMMLVLLYFLLAAGDMFKEKTVRLMPTFHDKRAVVSILMTIEKEVSGYLLTILLINIALGGVIGFGLYFMGLENALFWGMLAALLNFIPYIGYIIGALLVTVAALLQFPAVGDALIAPAIYTVANFVESSLVTPSLLGRRFTINPVVMFLSIAIWSWLWGIPGALMAVPLTVVLNVISSHVPSMAALNEYLSGKPRSQSSVIS
ncbi:AI-2E family transporter [Iodidimonas sp. SYSU 1G8]|uniref:AI-2E family transporter n=1 Tax=Iodidimonas sp. SYSU 1G8 TaxID=3133967 RepID=UPI0031FE4C03